MVTEVLQIGAGGRSDLKQVHDAKNAVFPGLAGWASEKRNTKIESRKAITPWQDGVERCSTPT